MAKAILADQKHKQVVASLDNFIPAAPGAKPVDKAKPDDKAKEDKAKAEAEHTERLMTASIEATAPSEKPRAVDPAKAHAAGMPQPIREGWLIQIAAVDNANDAKALLTRARSVGGEKLAAGTPVTEPFSKGSATLYRARFAGFPDQKAANAACSSLKRKDFACLVIHQ